MKLNYNLLLTQYVLLSWSHGIIWETRVSPKHVTVAEDIEYIGRFCGNRSSFRIQVLNELAENAKGFKKLLSGVFNSKVFELIGIFLQMREEVRETKKMKQDLQQVTWIKEPNSLWAGSPNISWTLQFYVFVFLNRELKKEVMSKK